MGLFNRWGILSLKQWRHIRPLLSEVVFCLFQKQQSVSRVLIVKNSTTGPTSTTYSYVVNTLVININTHYLRLYIKIYCCSHCCLCRSAVGLLAGLMENVWSTYKETLTWPLIRKWGHYEIHYGCAVGHCLISSVH